jgi:hypothetical protein
VKGKRPFSDEEWNLECSTGFVFAVHLDEVVEETSSGYEMYCEYVVF